MTTRENISLGTIAWDGTGDTLKSGGAKINNNFTKLWLKLGGDSNILSSGVTLNSSGIIFEGSLADSYETTIGVINPSIDRNINFPNASGLVILDSASQTLTNKSLISPSITTPKFNDASSTHQYNLITAELTNNQNINFPVLTDSDTFVFTGLSQTLTNKSLTTPSLSSPSISTAINDVNGAELIKITAAASSVNEITLSNAATSNNPSITVSGLDTNISFDLINKGTGAIRIKKTAHQAETITADGAVSLNYTYHDLNKSTALSLTLADGAVIGEQKIFTNRGAGVATITPTNFAQGTSFALAQNDGCSIIWDGTNWFLVGNQGQITIT